MRTIFVKEQGGATFFEFSSEIELEQIRVGLTVKGIPFMVDRLTSRVYLGVALDAASMGLEWICRVRVN